MAKGLKAKNTNLLLDGSIVLKNIAYISTKGKSQHMLCLDLLFSKVYIHQPCELKRVSTAASMLGLPKFTVKR